MRKLLFPAAGLILAMLLGLSGAIDTPDADHYRLLALGQRSAVPAPFSARILGPAIAGWLGRVTGLGVDTGFLVLGVACLATLIAILTAILWSWRAPAFVFAAIFLMPFWVDIFHDYYLPDLLHATILAAMLLCLLRGQTTLALLLLLPAYLARESTLLVALCLLYAGWRRIPRRAALAGAAALCAGIFISKHYAQGGAASVHGLGGGGYIAGKLVWNFCKNVLGLPLYSNTLPDCRPIRVLTLLRPLGAIRTVGLCAPSVWGPVDVLLAWFGIFGIGPGVALALRRIWWRTLVPRVAFADLPPGLAVVLRFCLVYGLISFFMAPLLGASIFRLVGYGWPFFFIMLPWFLASFPRPAFWLLPLHLFTCWLGWFGLGPGFGFMLACLAVLSLNGLGYTLVKRQAHA